MMVVHMKQRTFGSVCRVARGAVLIVALIFLLLLALVATTVIQTSELEFRMAGNVQFSEEAFQRTQAIATAVSTDSNSFPVVGDVGYTICNTVSTSVSPCDTTVITLDSNIVEHPTGVDLDYWVTREGPAILESIPFRQGESEASSITSYDAAVFEVHATYDGTDVRLGNAGIVHGVAVKIVASTQ